MKNLIILVHTLILAKFSFGVRPFITDDARVVGKRLAQWETWLRFDRHSGQTWHMFAYGPNNQMEITLGTVLGYDKPHPEQTQFSYAMPLLQGKFLFKEYRPGSGPGLALVAGSFLPSGHGAFVPPGHGAFAFLIASQCFGEGEKVLIHANLGQNYLYLNKQNTFLTTWGIGSQVKVKGGFHLVGEIFSGDPYIPGTGTAYQIGFRHFFSDLIQIDATVGEGIHGVNRMPFWSSIGARFVFTYFEKRFKLKSKV